MLTCVFDMLCNTLDTWQKRQRARKRALARRAAAAQAQAVQDAKPWFSFSKVSELF